MEHLVADNLAIVLRINPVERSGTAGKSNRPSRGMMIDTDLHRGGELSLAEFRRFLRDAELWTKETLPAILDVVLPGR